MTTQLVEDHVSVYLQWRHMGVMASQISCNLTMSSTPYSSKQQIRRQSSALLDLREVGPSVGSPRKGPVIEIGCHDVILDLT